MLEPLEGRRLCSAGSLPLSMVARLAVQGLYIDCTEDVAGTRGAVMSAVASASPTVTGIRLSSGAGAAFLDAFVAADVRLPTSGHGIDADRLTSATVRLYKSNLGPTSLVPANLDTSGGGDAIVLQPTGLLAPFTNYTFEVTAGLKDTSGAAFAPVKFKFNTADQTSASPTTGSFGKTALPSTEGQHWTAVTFGPDGKLYGGTLDGKIYRFALDAAGGLGAGELIDTIRANNGGNRLLAGIEFDPASTTSNLVLWVSHSDPSLEGASDWTGKISRLSGPNLQAYEDKVVGLPRSIRDHVTNQIKFGPDGALYVSQGSMTAMGRGDNAWGNREEHLLTGAMLRVDTKAIGGAVDVRTADGGTYNPFAAGAPVTLYATGIRNAWDMVWHRNGRLYVPTNGSAAGGNTPAGNGAPALTNVRETQSDYLFDVVKGGYYGHPNPKRGEYVLNGGNPTSRRDPHELSAYPVGTAPDGNYRGAAFDFGTNYSANGIIEYKATSFGGTFDGKLMVVRYSGGDDILVLEPNADGQIVATHRGVPGLTGFNDPIDLVQDPNTGNVYVAEHGGRKITLLKPTAVLGFDREQITFNDVGGGPGTATQYVTFTNRSKRSVTIPADGFSLAGKFAAMFRITDMPTEATTLAPKASLRVGVSFAASASTSAGIKWGLLRVRTSDPSRPPMDIPLRGLATKPKGAAEPSLQRILDVFNIGTSVGADGPSDEVAAERFYKAAVKEYISIEPLAVFGEYSKKASARVGWYDVTDRGLDTHLFTIAAGSHQTVAPVHADGDTFRFDPGAAGFGFYTQWPAFGNRGVYTEPQYNTWEPDAARRDKTRIYAYRTSEGALVPNTYIMSVEETTGDGDFQDGVFVIRNVRLSPPPSSVAPFRVKGLRLIDADTDQPISAFGNGITLDLSDGPFSVEAIIDGAGVGSVRFKLDGTQYNTEHFARYTLAGETGDDINPWTPTVGTHTLEARTYSGPDGTGLAGGFKRVTFHVVP